MKDVIKILADGQQHSGQAMGEQLGISRAAVWKQLSKLENLGLQLESLHGKGYRVPGGLDLLDSHKIMAKLERKSLIDKLDVFFETDSTNQRALEAAVNPGSAYVCLAECQTDGRGRLNRRWVSPLANSIYLSIKWQFEDGAAALDGLALTAGVIVAKTLKSRGVKDVSLKWPNDIVIGSHKLGGVLIEINGDLSGPCQTVIGIGINGALSNQAQEQIDIPHTDLAKLMNRLPDRNILAAALIDAFLELLPTYGAGEFGRIRDEWLDLDALRGKSVSVRLGANVERGVASGVDERGALLLQQKSGLKAFSGGEVTLRSQQ